MKNLPKVKPGTLLFGLLSLLLLLTLPISAVSAAQDIRVNIDGLELKTDVARLF